MSVFIDDRNNPQTNTPLLKESDRVRVCDNFECDDLDEHPMATELCPGCNKTMVSTTRGANLFVQY